MKGHCHLWQQRVPRMPDVEFRDLLGSRYLGIETPALPPEPARKVGHRRNHFYGASRQHCIMGNALVYEDAVGWLNFIGKEACKSKDLQIGRASCRERV